MNRLVFPRTVDPFTCVDVKFQGISGEGRAELSVSDNGEEYADEDTSYERNVLYDAYEVNVTREDGTVFTGYEACRYADLRIPADGVMTASYGSLQGFNFGYNYGFSYAHSFAGWTDAAEMEADLRNVRDGYRLAD